MICSLLNRLSRPTPSAWVGLLPAVLANYGGCRPFLQALRTDHQLHRHPLNREARCSVKRWQLSVQERIGRSGRRSLAAGDNSSGSGSQPRFTSTPQD